MKLAVHVAACAALLSLSLASASIVDIRPGDNGQCFIVHSDGTGVWASCPPDADQRSLDPVSKLSQASAKYLPRLRSFMDDALSNAAASSSSARRLLSRSFDAAPLKGSINSPPPAPLEANLQFITADQLLTYTLSPHKPLLLIPWYPSCTVCNATASIANEASKLLGQHAPAVRVIQWEEDGVWGSWLGNSSLLYILNASFQLPVPPVTFVMNGITWYSSGVDTVPSTEPPPVVQYAPLLNISLPSSCFGGGNLADDASEAHGSHDRHCVIEMAASMSRAVHVPLPVLCQSISCALLQRCSVAPGAASIVSDCSSDSAQAHSSRDRLNDKLSLDGSYAFSLDDFLGGNYARVKIIFDDGGSSAASDIFRLFTLLLHDLASPFDFAVMGDPELISRFNAPPSSLIITSFPYMNAPHVTTSSAWSLYELYRLFQ
jgi:hypothetical protein